MNCIYPMEKEADHFGMQPSSPGRAQGIDVSRYQGSINWSRVRADGVSFAFLKASQGQRYRDRTFKTNASGARKAGILIGAYHFVDAASVQEAKREAENFAAAIEEAGGAFAFQLPPVMDYESAAAGLKKSQVTQIAHAFLQEAERLIGVRPIVYTYPYFANNYFDDSLASYELWIARYANDPPGKIAGWSSWTFWQYSDGSQGGVRSSGSRSVDGISGPVDLNVYKGTVQELNATYGVNRGDENKPRDEDGADDKEGQPMTEAEKQQLEALIRRVAALEKRVNMSGNQTPPAWANDAIVAAKGAGYITTSNDKGHAELVMIQMLYNAGLCNDELVAFFREFSAETRAAIEALVKG
ncbi:glycoside hydrolase family 25 protein [Paenibacillus xylaniclasticus]|uniref:glycoside hydrolase family 25 protein n=1 Tax=Paenibacillus xylaniclasticus TaxID=588083 RepID=UPI001FE5AC32|nr:MULTISPECIES: glycoside hydrolase family 25 protein [Paenibacillus]